jgi:hypothetical protein
LNLKRQLPINSSYRGRQQARNGGPFVQQVAERLLRDEPEAIQGPQLLRSILQQVQESRQYSQGGLNGLGSGVAAGDGQGRLTGAPGLPGNATEQQRTAGDHLGMLLGLGKADKQVPPVVDQDNEAACQTAALEILGGIAAPASVADRPFGPI